MSKKISNIANDFIDPTVLEFKRFMSQKDAQLLWSARSAARRQALEEQDRSSSEQESFEVPSLSIRHNTWAIMPIVDSDEIAKVRDEWDRRAINTAWLVKKAKERLVWERRFKIGGFIVLGIMIVIIPIMFNSAMESSKVKKCKRNMKDILYALEEYSLENDRLPELVEDLAYISGYDSLGDYGARKRSYKCPSDKGSEPSYAINPDIVGRAWNELDGRTVMFVDSDQYIFENSNSLKYRHKHSMFGVQIALAIYKDATFGEYKKPKEHKVQKNKEVKSSAPKAMSSELYNKCQRDQQQCNRSCSAYRIGSEQNMNCTNDCWNRFNRCTQGE